MANSAPALHFKAKKGAAGHRIQIYLRGPQLKTARQIDNYSAFVQICTDNAADIMAWAMLNNVDPKKYKTNRYKLKDVLPEFNQKYPPDPLTAKRKKLSPTNSVPKPELW